MLFTSNTEQCVALAGLLWTVLMYNSHFETVSLSYLASATYLLLNSAQVRGYGVTLCKKKEPDLFQKLIGCGKRTNTVKSRTLVLVTH